MNYPSNSDNIDYFSYDNLSVNKNLIVSNNLSIKNSLFIDNVNILNNANFKGNINIKNYSIKVKKNINIEYNLDIKNNFLKLENNTNSNILNIDTARNSSIINISKNININNNLNSGSLYIKNDSFFKNNTLINNDIIVNNNFNIFKYNITSHNIFINKMFTIDKNINLNYIVVDNDFNLKGNLTCTDINVLNTLKIYNNTTISNGILTIKENKNINHLGQIIFNSNTNNIHVKINNNILNLNDLYSDDRKSYIKLHDNNNIDLNILNQKPFELTNNNLNITYNTNMYNLNIENTTNVIKDINIYNKLNSLNECNIGTGDLELPGPSNTKLEGSICYNNNTNTINVVYGNKWDELKFIDNYETGIIKNNNNILFKIKNNQYISLDNNININNNTIIKNNLFVSENLNIDNNLQVSKIIHINKIPLQFYRNLLRTYNSNEKKWYAITRQDYDSKYYTYFKSTNFYLHDISDEYQYCNTNNYLKSINILINNYDYFIYQLIDQITYFTHLFINIINFKNNNIDIQIYKNDILVQTLLINQSIQIIKLPNVLLYAKQDKLIIKIKSNSNHKESILINLLGYRLSNISFKGDSNFIFDSPIYINQNIDFKTNINIFKNSNILNVVSNNNILNTSKLYIKTISNQKSFLEIDKSFFIHNDSRVSIQSNQIKNKSFITINSDLIAKQDIYINQNLNILDKSYLNNVNTKNIINTNTLFISNSNSKVNLGSLSNFDTLISKNAIINNNLNLIDDDSNLNFFIGKNLVLSKYKSKFNNLLDNKSLYISCSNNSNISLIHNYNNIIKNYINHTNIKTINQNNIKFYDNLIIDNNNISISQNTTNDIFNIDNNFSIKQNGSFYINKDLIIKNINFSKKIKSLLYDIHN